MPSKARKAKTSSANPVQNAAPSTELPRPFLNPPPALLPLLPCLSVTRPSIYILSVDSHPSSFKYKIFLVPFFTQIVILGILMYRMSSIIPFYFSLILYLLFQTQNNKLVIQPAALSWREISTVVISRPGTFAIDFGLWKWIIPRVYGFFWGSVESGSPLGWRYHIGWKEKEVVVRRSREWGNEVSMQDMTFSDEMDEAKISRILDLSNRATEPLYMHEKTAYLMLNKEWDLDWRLMVLAHKLIDDGKIALGDLQQPKVLVYGGELHGWLTLDIDSTKGDPQEEGSKKMLAFKDEMTRLGKENLFFRWIELVQFESSKEEGWGPEQQKRTMDQVKIMFESEGVDFDAFWDKVGGMDGFLGM